MNIPWIGYIFKPTFYINFIATGDPTLILSQERGFLSNIEL